MITKKYSVRGMSCAACQAAVERAVSSVDGVQSANVSLMRGSMVIEYDGDRTDDGAIKKAVSDAGYEAGEWVKREVSEEEERRAFDKSVRRFTISAVLSVIIMYVSMGHMLSLPIPPFMDPHGSVVTPLIFAAVQFVIAAAVIAVNIGYFTDGFRSAFHKNPNMNTLVATGAAASMLYGIYIMILMLRATLSGGAAHEFSGELYFESVAMILTLVSLGKILETRAKHRASDAVRKLMELAPAEADVIRDGVIVTIKSDELAVGERVVIRAGGHVPCDGIIISGSGEADESIITGESVPVQKSVGDTLICGTILISGYAEIDAVHVGEDTTVAKITQLVDDAASSKAPAQKLADKISGIFVPIVLAIAAVTFVIWLITTKSLHTAVGFGISVLVISCPCALGLATPTAIMCGVGRAAAGGIIIKSADAVDVLNKATVAVFDKTGTVTEGRMQVTSVWVTEGCTEDELISASASLEAMSEHPIGAAIVDYAAGRDIVLSDVLDFSQKFGGGISGTINGRRYIGGNAKFIEKCGVTIQNDVNGRLKTYSVEGKTPVIFALDTEVIGMLALSDTIKPSSREAVARLKKRGINVIMLTGDNKTTAEAIAAEAGIDTVISGVLPDMKSEYVERLMSGEYFNDDERRYVIMVGDGVNDAPALAMADCGIAVAHGTDIAIESADVILVRNDLCDVSDAIELSHAVTRNIAENLIWAFGYNVLCIPLAAGVLFPAFGIALTPMIAAAAMSLSSVCVVSNALRLRGYKIKNH